MPRSADEPLSELVVTASRRPTRYTAIATVATAQTASLGRSADPLLPCSPPVCLMLPSVIGRHAADQCRFRRGASPSFALDRPLALTRPAGGDTVEGVDFASVCSLPSTAPHWPLGSEIRTLRDLNTTGD